MSEAQTNINDSLKRVNQDGSFVVGGDEVFGVWPKEAALELEKVPQQWVDGIKTAFANENTLHLLDAGCGNGVAFLSYIHALKDLPRLALHFQDVQQKAIDEVRKNYANLPIDRLTIDARVGDVSNLELASDSIHGAVSQSVLGWLPNALAIEQATSNLHRVLVKGGLVYASTMTPFNRVGLFNKSNIDDIDLETRKKEVEKLTRQEGETTNSIVTIHNERYQKDVHLFTEPALQRLFKDAGFQIVISRSFRNQKFPNGLSDEYLENVELIAKKD